MKLFDKILFWLSGDQTFVLVEDTSLIVILDRNGERFEWPCERVSDTILHGQVCELKRVDESREELVSMRFVNFPDDAIRFAQESLKEKGVDLVVFI